MKIYVVAGEVPIDPDNLFEVGYLTASRATAAMRDIAPHRISPSGLSIEEREFDLPADAFPDGSTISVELHRGGRSDDDGIQSGGTWQKAVGIAHIDRIELWHERGVQGHVTEIGTDRFMQNMPLHVGLQGYPYRNAQLIRARTSQEDGSY